MNNITMVRRSKLSNAAKADVHHGSFARWQDHQLSNPLLVMGFLWTLMYLMAIMLDPDPDLSVWTMLGLYLIGYGTLAVATRVVVSNDGVGE
jgi:hypothetical protein